MRVFVRLIAVSLGLIVAASGALLAIEVVWAWLRPDTSGLVVPWIAITTSLGETPWSDPSVQLTAALAGFAGLALMFAAIRAVPRRIRLDDLTPGVAVTTDPRSLARLVGHRVRDQEGVATASVTATRKRVRVKATSRSTDLEELRGRLSACATEALDELPLRAAPDVSVAVSSAKEQR